MNDPGTLRADIVTAMRGNASLVAELGGDGANITQYIESEDSSLEEAVLALQSPAALVAWRGTNTDRGRRADAIVHRFIAIFRLAGAASPVWTAFREGVTSGQKFKLLQVNNSVLPPAEMTCNMRSLSFADSVAIEYLEITFAISERGIDN